ncbi:uncharacterized protein EDB93DRAFT_1102634 [Suillus bovinus]|uniref:uncharacterized protein n=1 Tax=Suillus bovinus TaxID=48563 RepID=UPI001B87BC62|nr:uncharacterized protein EDB93DRAFT_1102634 [Suillus bovinus]KAG2153484.1 hypothetical protein EDB93DRAFT_1102634 [Suillus bovinus]
MTGALEKLMSPPFMIMGNSLLTYLLLIVPGALEKLISAPFMIMGNHLYQSTSSQLLATARQLVNYHHACLMTYVIEHLTIKQCNRFLEEKNAILEVNKPSCKASKAPSQLLAFDEEVKMFARKYGIIYNKHLKQRDTIDELCRLLGTTPRSRTYPLFPPILFPNTIINTSNSPVFGNWKPLAQILKVVLMGKASLMSVKKGGPPRNFQNWGVSAIMPREIAWSTTILQEDSVHVDSTTLDGESHSQDVSVSILIRATAMLIQVIALPFAETRAMLIEVIAHCSQCLGCWLNFQLNTTGTGFTLNPGCTATS